MDKIIKFFLVVIFVKNLRAQNEEVCLTRRDHEPPPEVRQGRPGKMGPMGPSGAVGQQGRPGPPGACVCGQELEEIRNTLRKYRVSSCGVGMRDGRVRDSFITASSVHSVPWNARRGRLDELHYCWHAANPIELLGQWIQVDLQAPVRVIAVVTQGRPRDNNQYITSYKIQYGNSTGNLETIENNDGIDMIFQGNTDTTSYKVNEFSQPITARYFRLVVISWNEYVCMRLEYLTC